VNILIRGGGFSNKGDEAMGHTVRRELTKRIPNANFWSTLPVEQATYAFSSGIFPSFNAGGRTRKAISLLWSAIGNSHVRRACIINPLSAMEIADLNHIDSVIDISGFAYSDLWGAEISRRGLAWAKYCHDTGKPYICMPQAWGPFTNNEVRRSVKKLCQYASIVYARDEVSLSNLKAILNLSDDNLRNAPDIAFRFYGDRQDAGAAVLCGLGIEVGKYPIVGLTPNIRAYERLNGIGRANSYLNLLIDIARFCVHEMGAAIILIPHEIQLGRTPKISDNFLCGMIKSALAEEGISAAMSGFYFADTSWSVIANLDLVIGSRFHTLIFALSSEIPAIAIGWAHKYAELMGLFGLDRFVLEHSQLKTDKMKELLVEAWENKDNIKQILSGGLPGIREQVDKVFDDVATILK
jgi:colanic acid/amylovoran biosynthesis protein